MRKILSMKVKFTHKTRSLNFNDSFDLLLQLEQNAFCYLFTVCYGFHKYRTPHNMFVPANKQIANVLYKKLLFFKYAVFLVYLMI